MQYSLDKHLAALEIYGDDAAKFLQGQLTNDIYQLNNTNFAQISAHLNNKGRIISNFIILLLEQNHYCLILPHDLINTLMPRLKMFILRSKVTIQQSNKQILLSKTYSNNSKVFYSIGEYALSMNVAISDYPDIEANIWHKLLIDNNFPFIYHATTEKIIPQQINFELMNGVNFKKGCYTGQEIVARTHYLGKVKRRLVKFSSIIKPEIGQTITSKKIDNQEIGFVVEYYFDNDKYIGLASIQLDYIDDAQINNTNLPCLIIGENNA